MERSTSKRRRRRFVPMFLFFAIGNHRPSWGFSRDACRPSHISCNVRSPFQTSHTSLNPVRGASLPIFFAARNAGHHIPEHEPKQKNSTLLWSAPLWTILAASIGLAPATQPWIASTSLKPLQVALSVLMLAMGITITPPQLQAATKQPRAIFLNAICCFGIMPLLAVTLSKCLCLSSSQTIGTILLGSVSGGQASNLFALLAGGDVALSVVCTLSTTLMGVLATPLLIQWLLGCSVPVQLLGVLKSVASLVLFPLVTGLLLGNVVPERIVRSVRSVCPRIGIGATTVLVAGGAANMASAVSLHGSLVSTVGVSVLLPLLGGAVALLLSRNFAETSKRTVVVEVLSKSPTLAHVLALQHFDVAAACIPAAAMVSLAVLGSIVAAVWQSVDPILVVKD